MALVIGKPGSLQIRTDLDDLARKLKRFSHVGLRRASFRAINKSLGPARTVAIRQIAARRNLTAKQVRPGTRLIKATFQRLGGSIEARGPVIRLIDVKGAKTQTRLGVKATPEKGKRKLYPGAFIATMPGGHKGIFKRAQLAPRLPIVELTLPSVAHTLVEPKIQQAVRDKFIDDYDLQIERQLNAEIKRAQRAR